MERTRQVKKKLTEQEAFAHRLCLALGGENIHPDVLLPKLTFQQYLNWQTYFSQEPWGELRADMRSMVLAAYINSPHTPVGTELPNPTFPYFEDMSPEGIADKAQDVKEWIAANRDWLNGNHDRQDGGRSDERHNAV